MKKFLIILLVLSFLCSSAYACEELTTYDILPIHESILPNTRPTACEQTQEYYRYTGISYWGIEQTSKEVGGTTSPNEKLKSEPQAVKETKYIRGIVGDGYIRYKIAIKFFMLPDGTPAGLTPLDVPVYIKKGCAELVQEVVHRIYGPDAPVCPQTIIGATYWFTECDALDHIFWTDEHVIFDIGYVEHNEGTEKPRIYCGDFDGDELPEFGFIPMGLPSAPKKTEEPQKTDDPAPTATPAPTSKPQSQTQDTKSQDQKSCDKGTIKICWDLGFDVSVWFRGCMTFFQGCSKAMQK